MSDVDEFIEGLLVHGRFYDPRKAREYYLRTRKLVGRKAKKVQKSIDDSVYTPKEWRDNRKSAMDRIENRYKPGGSYDQERANRKERVEVQERKLKQARERAKKLSPEKRNAVEKKLDAAERRLKKVKRKLLKNPFKTKTIDRSGPVREIQSRSPGAIDRRTFNKSTAGNAIRIGRMEGKAAVGRAQKRARSRS